MSNTAQRRSFLIRIAFEGRQALILEFHRDHLTEYLWPRTLEEFTDLARKECLYEVLETTSGAEQLAGICYICHGNEPNPPHSERAEFGGIYVTTECRGLGVATALGKVAISNHFVVDPPRGPLIGHVHEANPLPRGILQNQLGFVLTGQEIPPPENAPASMARNDNGDVVADLFEFRRSTLLRFADWIEEFSGSIGPAAASTLDIEVPTFTRFRANALEALRSLGS